jgi:hypothetical protein
MSSDGEDEGDDSLARLASIWKGKSKGKRQRDEAPLPRRRGDPPEERDVSRLWVHNATLACAMGGCVPCVYKIYPLGGHGLPPNKRPELCPRSANAPEAADAVGIFAKGMKILMLGDGDFSFSLAVAKGLGLGAPAGMARVHRAAAP